MQFDHENRSGGTRMKGILPQDRASHPLLTIIVVAFRDREEVAALIDTVAPFRGPDVELVIIDGNSEDGTLELLQARNEAVDYWVSEPDNGIYDAMNKGIDVARGEYIFHLNAGDRLLELPLAQLTTMANRHVDVVCCRVLEDDTHLYIPRNDWLLWFDNTWHHQGTFYRRSNHLRYDTAYRVFGDFDHNQRLRKAGCTVELLDTTVATHRTDGVSRNRETRNEIYRSIRSNFGPLYMGPAFARFTLLKLRSMIRRSLVARH
jgi:glycosyltransferase involved in cell wall biosynthesis